MRSKTYPCDESREWYEWESRYWDEYKLRKHGDDLDEMRWQENERRRMQRDNDACGYTPAETEGENDMDS